MYKVDRNQGEGQSGYDFGYIFVADGGIFFTWRYDPNAHYYEQVRQVVGTMEEDEVDPPTGHWSWAVAEQSLRHHIAQHGLAPLPAVRC